MDTCLCNSYGHLYVENRLFVQSRVPLILYHICSYSPLRTRSGSISFLRATASLYPPHRYHSECCRPSRLPPVWHSVAQMWFECTTVRSCIGVEHLYHNPFVRFLLDACTLISAPQEGPLAYLFITLLIVSSSSIFLSYSITRHGVSHISHTHTPHISHNL